MKNILLICSTIIAIAACNSNKSGSDKKTQILQDNKNKIIPEGIYATNTAIPINSFNVINVIDSDPTTLWKTPLGSGTDEGIMFYFAEPVEIGSIKLVMAKGAEFADIKSFSVYGNGIILKDKNRANEKFDINTKVSSLYIRLGEREDKIEIKNNSEPDDYSIANKQEYYPTSKCVGISEIEFYDKIGNKINIQPPALVDCKITASSILNPTLAYSPDNLIDSKKEFGWAEGASGNGESEWVSFKFEDNVTITEFKLWNGYQRSESHYTNNTRAKEITFSVQGGKEQIFTLSDSQAPQAFILNEAVRGKEFKLKINSVFPGKSYKDLVLSEIVFFNNDQPIKPITSFEQERITASNQIKNKQLKNILDRLIKTTYKTQDYDMGNGISHSLIIRSNNSFVYYGDSYMGIDYNSEIQKSTIAEGNWEFIEEKDNAARIRIFGKIYESSYESMPYKGISEKVATNIFQDFLTISESTIVGDSFIEKIELLW